jgi:hypothetical protein
MAKKTKQTKRKGKVDTGKAILYFIEQKILEIIGVVLALWMIYLLGYWNPFRIYENMFDKNIGGYFCMGGLTLMIGALFALGILILVMSIYSLCKVNWEWAKRRASKC